MSATITRLKDLEDFLRPKGSGDKTVKEMLVEVKKQDNSYRTRSRQRRELAAMKKICGSTV